MRPFAMASVAAGLAQRAGPRLFLLVAAGGQPALAGLLQIAFRLAEQARDLPAPFVHRFALPPLSRLAPDRAAFLQRLDALALLSGLAFAPAFAGLALCAREVQALLLGPGWAGVAAPLAVLAATLALLAPRLPLGLAFTAAGRPEVGLRLTLLSLGLLVALAVAAAGHGGMAAAVAWAVSLLLGTLAAGVAAAWCLGWGLARQARGWALSLLPAAAVAAAVLGAEAGGLLPDGPLGALAAKAALGGLAGLPAMLALARRPWREIASAAA
jgi:O-antigen/teichoic acid export membrane protein